MTRYSLPGHLFAHLSHTSAPGNSPQTNATLMRMPRPVSIMHDDPYFPWYRLNNIPGYLRPAVILPGKQTPSMQSYRTSVVSHFFNINGYVFM